MKKSITKEIQSFIRDVINALESPQDTIQANLYLRARQLLNKYSGEAKEPCTIIFVKTHKDACMVDFIVGSMYTSFTMQNIYSVNYIENVARFISVKKALHIARESAVKVSEKPHPVKSVDN